MASASASDQKLRRPALTAMVVVGVVDDGDDACAREGFGPYLGFLSAFGCAGARSTARSPKIAANRRASP